MALNVVPFKLKSTAKDSATLKNNVPYEKLQEKLTLKEMQAILYPFLNSDVLGIFYDLLEANHEDSLLGSKPHNRPLFMARYALEQKVNRILIDGGSVVNILPLQTLNELGIPMDELSNSHLMIEGFKGTKSYWCYKNGIVDE
ncbi:UNVERIFIED_CONTAM: hypothetical protein Scaly_1782000 [Sesamum calycinum]|uniref:Uncharacterized protein n=1 Tax=Sesamum calycinum TaxID=2727403 RepID=A0AAW2NVR9_9LAMI